MILLLSLPTSLALASPDKAVPIEKGQAAPFSGQLLPTDLAIKLAQKADHCDALWSAELEKVKALAKQDLELAYRLRDIEQQRGDDIAQAAKDQAAQADSFLRSPVFVATVSVVTALGLVLVTGYAMKGID